MVRPEREPVTTPNHIITGVNKEGVVGLQITQKESTPGWISPALPRRIWHRRKGNTRDVDELCKKEKKERKKDANTKPEHPKLIRQSATLAAPALVVAAQSWQK